MKFNLIFLLILLLLTCDKTPSDILNEEFIIYSAFLNSFSEEEGFKSESINIAILDSTFIRSDFSLNDTRIAKLKEDWDIELPKDLIEDFLKKNSSVFLVQDRFETDLKYQLLATDNFFKTINASFGWLDFREKYPEITSVVSFSRIGINNQKDKALIFVSINCGPLCGSTWYIFLEKANNKWDLTKEHKLTVS